MSPFYDKKGGSSFDAPSFAGTYSGTSIDNGASRGGTISLYIHIPFCSRKCDYSDFFSLPHQDGATINAVVRETVEQFKYYYDLLGHPPIASIYIGGGTPSLLPPDVLKTLLQVIEYECSGRAAPGDYKNIEKTIECNPETITEQWFESALNNGITRLSIGVQSLNRKLLKEIGRSQDPDVVYRALRMVEQINIKKNLPCDLTCDVLTQIPGQTESDVIYTLGELSNFNPAHISLYNLTLEPGTPLYERLHNNPTRKTRQREFHDDPLVSYLAEAGYRRYEISNYAKPGKESTHNKHYWHMDPYLGIGPGAVSTFPPFAFTNPLLGAPDPVDLPCRLQVKPDLASFLKGKENGWGVEAETISRKEYFLEHLIMGFRLLEGIETATMTARFGAGWEDHIAATLASWKEFLQTDTNRIRLTPGGLLWLNKFLLDCAVEIDI